MREKEKLRVLSLTERKTVPVSRFRVEQHLPLLKKEKFRYYILTCLLDKNLLLSFLLRWLEYTLLHTRQSGRVIVYAKNNFVMKILCLVDGKNVPASRFRFYQYAPYLKKQGFKLKISPVWPAKDFSPRQLMPEIYRISRWLARFIGFFLFLFIFLKRFFDILQAVFYDVVVFQRELFPFGPPVLEYFCRILNKNIIFDFDDAIFLKNEKKIIQILKLSKLVIAGNEYLAEFARRYASNVYVLPTPIDTNVYLKRITNNKQQATITIGWSGTPSTLQYLNLLKPVFEFLLQKYPNLRIKILSSFRGMNFKFLENTEYIEWSAKNEIKEISSFDIGVMPLTDDKWSKGKCGFKIIQYMAVGIPTVASPVGVNKEIIQDGINGFLADTQETWIQKLSLLIEDSNLRERFGISGRKTVEEKYSIKTNLPKLIEILQRVYKK